MATSEAFKQVSRRGVNFRSGSDSGSRNMGVDVRHISESGSVAVAVVCLILFLLIVPLLLMIYFDTLKAQYKVDKSVEKVEKLIKQMEKEKEKQ